ncbi:MAG: Dabb family protein, partial [Verrucomicrobiota bacterium]
MKSLLKPILLLLAVAFFLTGCEKPAANFDGKFRHIVCMQFKPEVTPEEIDHVMKEFAALEDLVPSIIDYEWGTEDNA